MINSAITVGTDTVPVTIEVTPTPGQRFSVETLTPNAEKEIRLRVRSAAAALDRELPDVRVRVLGVVDGSPAGLDLPIVLAVLSPKAAHDHLPLFAIGDLSLGGEVRSVRGVYGFAELAQRAGFAPLIPASQVYEPGALAVGVQTLREALEIAENGFSPSAHADGLRRRTVAPMAAPPYTGPDLSDITGCHAGKRALEIAAAGGHGLLLVGPPGSGKTMLARRLPGILPEPSGEELSTMRRIASAAWLDPTSVRRPFRAPHHTASIAAMVGGGGDPIRPGEVTLAHGGVLFLDELTEYQRGVVEVLRTALVAGRSWVRGGVYMLARPACVIAATNHCPCGWTGDRKRACTCKPSHVASYLARLEPTRAVFPMRVVLQGEAFPEQFSRGDTSAVVRERVTRASAKLAEGAARWTDAALDLLERATARRGIEDARDTVASIARTITALADENVVGEAYVAEALALVNVVNNPPA